MTSNLTTDVIDGHDTRIWYEPLPRLWFWAIGDEEEPWDAGSHRQREEAMLDMLDALDNTPIAA